jgi:hypothetical protein
MSVEELAKAPHPSSFVRRREPNYCLREAEKWDSRLRGNDVLPHVTRIELFKK